MKKENVSHSHSYDTTSFNNCLRIVSRHMESAWSIQLQPPISDGIEGSRQHLNNATDELCVTPWPNGEVEEPLRAFCDVRSKETVNEDVVKTIHQMMYNQFTMFPYFNRNGCWMTLTRAIKKAARHQRVDESNGYFIVLGICTKQWTICRIQLFVNRKMCISMRALQDVLELFKECTSRNWDKQSASFAPHKLEAAEDARQYTQQLPHAMRQVEVAHVQKTFFSEQPWRAYLPQEPRFFAIGGLVLCPRDSGAIRAVQTLITCTQDASAVVVPHKFGTKRPPGHFANGLSTNATLIICTNSMLCCEWKDALEQAGLRVLYINTRLQHQQTTMHNINQCDVVLTHTLFVRGAYYQQWVRDASVWDFGRTPAMTLIQSLHYSRNQKVYAKRNHIGAVCLHDIYWRRVVCAHTPLPRTLSQPLVYMHKHVTDKTMRVVYESWSTDALWLLACSEYETVDESLLLRLLVRPVDTSNSAHHWSKAMIQHLSSSVALALPAPLIGLRMVSKTCAPRCTVVRVVPSAEEREQWSVLATTRRWRLCLNRVFDQCVYVEGYAESVRQGESMRSLSTSANHGIRAVGDLSVLSTFYIVNVEEDGSRVKKWVNDVFRRLQRSALAVKDKPVSESRVKMLARAKTCVNRELGALIETQAHEFTCPICLLDRDERAQVNALNALVLFLPCGHLICYACMQQMLHVQKQCGVCKNPNNKLGRLVFCDAQRMYGTKMERMLQLVQKSARSGHVSLLYAGKPELCLFLARFITAQSGLSVYILNNTDRTYRKLRNRQAQVVVVDGNNMRDTLTSVVDCVDDVIFMHPPLLLSSSDNLKGDAQAVHELLRNVNSFRRQQAQLAASRVALHVHWLVTEGWEDDCLVEETDWRLPPFEAVLARE